jgi:hypothetical protein
MVLCSGMAILGIDSMVRLALGVVYGDGDLHMIRNILDECIEGLEVKAEIKGSRQAMPDLRGERLWAISAHLVKPRKGRADYISRPSEMLISALWEIAVGGNGLLDLPRLMASSNWHDGEMIKRLRML